MHTVRSLSLPNASGSAVFSNKAEGYVPFRGSSPKDWKSHLEFALRLRGTFLRPRWKPWHGGQGNAQTLRVQRRMPEVWNALAPPYGWRASANRNHTRGTLDSFVVRATERANTGR